MRNKKYQFSCTTIWSACLDSWLFSFLFAGLTIAVYLSAGDWHMLFKVILLFAFVLGIIYFLSDHGQPLVFQVLGFIVPVLVASLLVPFYLGDLIFWFILGALCLILILYFNKQRNWLTLGWQLTWNSLSLVLYYFLSI